MTTISENDRFVRQQELVPRDRLVNLKVTVIGVGCSATIILSLEQQLEFPSFPSKNQRRAAPLL